MRIILAAFLTALWLARAISCVGEPVFGFPAACACPATTDSGATCEGCPLDQATLVTERRHTPSRQVAIPRSFLLPLGLGAAIAEQLPTLNEAPQLMACAWQFHERAALPPRAPSSLL